jgi:hypothetical protein
VQTAARRLLVLGNIATLQRLSFTDIRFEGICNVDIAHRQTEQLDFYILQVRGMNDVILMMLLLLLHERRKNRQFME